MTQARLDSLQAALAGLSYRKADVDIPYGNFCLQSGDIITVTTTGSNLKVPIMANSWTYDGGLSSSVGSYGVSDYSGTANNAERSISSQRVINVLKEKQELTVIQGEVQHATDMITGATGGVIKINFGGNGQTAELLILDTGNISTAQDVWRMNQGGFGHSGTGYAGPYTTAITADGHVVADVIAGNKISGVKFENTLNLYGNRVVIEDGQYAIYRMAEISGEIVPVKVGNIVYRSRHNVDDTDSLAIEAVDGGSVSIGMLNNAAFVYYSDYTIVDPTSDPNNKQKCVFMENARFDKDLEFLKSNDHYETLKNLEDRVADLEQRVAALEA
jgi:hypothetical protein